LSRSELPSGPLSTVDPAPASTSVIGLHIVNLPRRKKMRFDKCKLNAEITIMIF
jgi:hypothetical protein